MYEISAPTTCVSLESDHNPNNLNAFPSQSQSHFSLFPLIFPPLISPSTNGGRRSLS